MKTILLSITCLLSSTLSLATNGDWELEKNESGIKVYTRTIDGEDIREFKATVLIDAPVKKVADIILDINNYSTWYPQISESKIIKKINSNEYYVYNVLDLPWPSSDRDGVSKMNITITEAATTIKMEAINGVKPKNPDYVRITKSYGFWKFTKQGTKTSLHFQYFANPGGSLPDWIINMFIVDNPFETLQILRTKAKS
jgi:hypothetical protein